MDTTKCEQTGLTKTQKKHWIIRSDDEDTNSWASLYLLGDDIFVGEWHGYITRELNKKSDIIFNEILNTFNLREKGYHFILNNIDVKGTSIEVRTQYTSFLNEEIRFMKSHIFVGLNPVLKFITNIAMKFNKDFLITEYYKNLPDAISALNKNKHRKVRSNKERTKTSKIEQQVEEIKAEIELVATQDNNIDRSEEMVWRYKNEETGYSIYGEVIDERIIYCGQQGVKTEKDLNIFFKINDEMLLEQNNSKAILLEYITGAKRVSNQHRKSIISFYFSLIGRISHLIFVKPSVYQRASILMSKYLLQSRYKIHIVKTKGEAYELARKIKNEEIEDEQIDCDIVPSKSNTQINFRINQLLNIVGRITWDPTFVDDYNEDIIGNDEFSIVFESFEMLRSDIISMKKDLENNAEKLRIEVAKATDKLRKQNIELKKAKNIAEQANKLKSAFLANMSHEIRTPMNAIVGFTDALKSGDVSEENKTLYLDLISKSNTHLLKLINDIVDISKIESKEMKISSHKFNLNELMRGLLESQKIILKNSEKHDKIEYSLSLGLSDELSNINTDSTRLRQILLNLLNNAFKFTPEGKIEFGYNLIGDNLHFYVKDPGIGIEKSKQEHIFDRFAQAETDTTRKYGGTGLGLSISKSLVELCGGTISVESTLGKGSTFTFTLSYQCKTDEETNDTTITVNKLDLKGLNILVAEDDILNFTVLKALLNPLGCNLERVETGVEAVAEIENNRGYDIILMDIQMPKMDGIEATKLIREITSDIPIIALTANAFEDEMQRIRDAGCVDYITKPINKNVLIKSIQNNINRSYPNLLT
jgi:signal transduction histidine kinase/ActR/RegA family two-component response regulator